MTPLPRPIWPGKTRRDDDPNHAHQSEQDWWHQHLEQVGRDWQKLVDAVEALEAILRRDLRTMRKHKCRSFIRKPYADLNEIGMISFVPNVPQEVAAVVVIGIAPGEINARIPVELDLIESIVKSRRHLDLYSLKTKKGFGGQSK